MRLGGRPVRIIDVLPQPTAYPSDVQAWMPLDLSLLGRDERTRRDNFIFGAIGRLAPGATLLQAQTRVAAIAQRVAREFPESRRHWTAGVITLREFMVENELRQALLVLLAGVGAVLLIVCVNVANLIVSRGTGRAREMSIRLVKVPGARSSRVSCSSRTPLLGGAGGVAGVLLASWMIRALLLLAPEGVPFVDRMSLDAAGLAAAIAITFVCVLAIKIGGCQIAPAQPTLVIAIVS